MTCLENKKMHMRSIQVHFLFSGNEKKLILSAQVVLRFRNVASKCIPIWDRFARIL